MSIENEKDFQKELMKELTASGYYVAHLSPPSHPGWQDVLALIGDYALLIELKDFSLKDKPKPFKKLFTSAQFPRYMNQLDNNLRGFWVCLYGHDEPDFKYFVLYISSKQFVSTLLECSLDDALNYGTPFLTERGMIKYMTQVTTGTMPF